MPAHHQPEINNNSKNPDMFHNDNRAIRFALVVHNPDTHFYEVEGYNVPRGPKETAAEFEARIKETLAAHPHERLELILAINKDGRWHAAGRHFPSPPVSADSVQELKGKLWDALLVQPGSVCTHPTSLALVKPPLPPQYVPRCIVALWNQHAKLWVVEGYVLRDVGYDPPALEQRIRALLDIPTEEPLSIGIAFWHEGRWIACLAHALEVDVFADNYDDLAVKLSVRIANLPPDERIWKRPAGEQQKEGKAGTALQH